MFIPTNSQSHLAAFALLLSGVIYSPAAIAADSDALPARAKVRIGTTRLRHGDTVNAIGFAPDGRTLATASRDSTISVWNLASGDERMRCQGHRGAVLAVVFTPDGKQLVSGGADGTIRLWRSPRSSDGFAAGKEVKSFRISAEAVQTIAFSADASTAAAGTAGGDIFVCNVAKGKRVRHLRQEGQVYCLALSSDGKKLAANYAARGLALWDLTTDKEPQLFSEEVVASLAFAPDGRALAIGDHDNRLVLWDTKDGRVIWGFAGHERGSSGQFNGVLGVVFSVDGRRLISGGTDNAVRVWDVKSGREVHAFKAHRDWVTAVAIAADGKHLASGAGDNTVRIWEIASGRAVGTESEPAAALSGVSLSPDGRMLALVQSPGRFSLWDTGAGRQMPTPATLGDSKAVMIAPDGPMLAAAGSDGRLRFWDMRKRSVWTSEREALRSMDRLVWSANGKAVASRGPDCAVDLWDPLKGDLLQHMGLQKQPYLALAFDRQGRRLAAASETDLIRLWDSSTGLEQSPITGRFAGALVLSFSDDGRSLFAAGSDGTIRLWELVTRQPRRTFAIPTVHITAAVFSPDGRFLAIGGSDGTVSLWDTEAGAERHVLRGHRGAITSLAFAARAPLLASASRDTTALVWDLTNLLKVEMPSPLDLSAREMETLWENLASSPPTAFEALRKLRRAPGQTIPYLRARLRPVRDNFAQMLADLDSEDYQTRMQALHDLRRFGRVAEKSLRRALENKPSLEVRRRLEQLLEEMPDGPDRVRADPRDVRGVELLEDIGTTEARRVLQTLADGLEESELSQEARASLARLAHRGSERDP